jgi:hypothetical protein
MKLTSSAKAQGKATIFLLLFAITLIVCSGCEGDLGGYKCDIADLSADLQALNSRIIMNCFALFKAACLDGQRARLAVQARASEIVFVIRVANWLVPSKKFN